MKRFICLIIILLSETGICESAIYYVNDDSTSGDIWCTAVGVDAPGRGETSNPYRTVNYLLNDRALAPGDEIRIDTGFYTGSGNSIRISPPDTGAPDNYLIMQGAGTNRTIIDMNCSYSYALCITNNKWIKIFNIRFEDGSDDTIILVRATNCMISNCLITTGKTGITIKDYSVNNKVVNCIIRDFGSCGTTGEAFGIYLKNFCYNNLFFKNKITGIYSDSSDPYSSDGIRHTAYSSNNIFRSNIIYKCRTRGILIQQEFSAIPKATIIDGNTIYSNGEEGIKIIDSGANYTRIINNKIYGNGNNGNIEMRNTSYCIISNNLLYNCRDTASGEKLGIGMWVVNNSTIWGNKIWGNISDGIKLTDNGADRNIIKYNIITNNNGFGINLYDAENNRIECNIIKNNGRSGIWINHYSKSNVIKTNLVDYNGYSGDTDQNRCGIFIGNQSDDCQLFRNRISRNRQDGLRTQDTEGLWVWRPKVINNTFFKNQGRGVLFDNNSKDCTLRNNIAESNTDYGFQIVATANFLQHTYNNSYGNSVGQYSYGQDSTETSVKSDFKSTNPASTEFLHLKLLSPCVDTGDPSDPVPPGGGICIDKGAIECINALVLTKSISQMTLKGIPVNVPRPGVTIRFQIKYTNQGKAITNCIIFDKLPSNVIYKTNSYTTNGGWSCQWSTNNTPDQSYNSANYVSVQPPVSKIKWIRWKKLKSNQGDSGNVYYSVIIQ